VDLSFGMSLLLISMKGGGMDLEGKKCPIACILVFFIMK